MQIGARQIASGEVYRAQSDARRITCPDSFEYIVPIVRRHVSHPQNSSIPESLLSIQSP
ncbi:MAG: hypothetical protein AMXMBFR4_11300 [Candidatus Hydrogenedentota bacterium]